MQVVNTDRLDEHGSAALPDLDASANRIAGVRQQKLARVRLGEAPRTLDLFAGCGGLSLGFKRAGFNITAAVELDPLAAQSHAVNFHDNASEDFRRLHARHRDITETEPEDLVAELKLGQEVMDSVDILVGGPPCQAYARVGRAKLREIAEHPEAFRQDPRGNLYLRYLHYVSVLQPLAILVENVPDILNYGGHNIAQEMCEALADLGYTAKYTLLNAAYYGVPQMRERAFLIAYVNEIDSKIIFPSPTHWVELPPGYAGARQVALQSVVPDLFSPNAADYFVAAPTASPGLSPAITAREALADLPRITAHLEGKMPRGTRRFDTLIPYPHDAPTSAYAQMMRTWPGYESPGGVSDHVIRSLPRDYAIFRRMNPGDQYPEAHRHAVELFKERLAEEEKRLGRPLNRESREYDILYDMMVPPYDTGKFPNKWRKMEADFPARTLMAHLGKDGYSHIHYDSDQARTISVREAARLQSFPDGFRFCGTMNPAFRQIGNAVPPLMAYVLANTIMHALVGR